MSSLVFCSFIFLSASLRLAARKARNYDGIRAEKASARYGYDEDDDANYVVENVVREVVISAKEEVVAVL